MTPAQIFNACAVRCGTATTVAVASIVASSATGRYLGDVDREVTGFSFIEIFQRRVKTLNPLGCSRV